MARGKPKNDVIDPPASVLDQTEPEIPVMGVGEVIEEHVNTWDAEAKLAETQMSGDIAKMILAQIKALPSHWGTMTPNQQTDLISSVSAGAANIASQAIEFIAAKGRRIVKGHMKQVTIKDEIQLTITCQRSPEACSAMGMAASGGQVAFLLLDTDGLLELGSPIEADPVQKELDFDSANERDLDTEVSSTDEVECPL